MRLHRVDALITRGQEPTLTRTTLAFCLGLDGDVYLRLLREGQFITKRIPTSVLCLQGIIGYERLEWGNTQFFFRFARGYVLAASDRDTYGTIPTEDLEAAVRAFIESPIVREHAGLFRMNAPMIGGGEQLAMILDFDGEIILRLWRPPSDQAAPEFVGPPVRTTRAELVRFLEGEMLNVPPMALVREKELGGTYPGYVCTYLYLQGKKRGHRLTKDMELAVERFVRNAVVERHAASE